MASAFGFNPGNTQPAPSSQAIGRALLSRRMASDPANQTMTPQVGNTMQGQLPQVGKRLLLASPAQQTSSAFPQSGMPYAGAT